ncbi:MAG: RNA polymerase sigma factor [Alphaproteobacteria bacterium]
MQSPTYCRFQTTQWTVVRALNNGDAEERRRALELLSNRYWPPVYSHLRSTGKSADEAADLTQEFFSQVIFGRKLLDKADERRGRLRSLILATLKRFVIDQHRHNQVRGSEQTIPLDLIRDEEARCPLSALGNSGDPFERRWAMSSLEEALHRCEKHFLSSNRQRHWRLFDRWVIQPAIRGTGQRDLAEVAREVGFPTAAQAASALQVVRNRTMALLREVAAETVEDEADVDRELALIRECVSV